MAILIVGARGNMGRRYSAILTYLGKQWVGVDSDNNRHYINDLASKSDGIVIATPTATHTALIRQFMHLKKPILCEKPLTTDIVEMRALTAELKSANTNLTMVYQYKELVQNPSIGWTYYNNWNHGKDGLVWDCIQIIGLARSEISLQEDSPIWKCRINGASLDLSQMDRAYVKMMNRWISTPGQDISEIHNIHEKTNAFAVGVKNVTD